MEQRLTLVSLGVSDLEYSTRFYQKSFGWVKHAGSNDHITFFQLNGILFGLYPRDLLAEDAKVSPKGSGFNGFTLTHNARSKQDVDELFRLLAGRGVQVVKPPEETDWGGYSGYLADPDGHLWEIAYNPFLPLDEVGNV